MSYSALASASEVFDAYLYGKRHVDTVKYLEERGSGFGSRLAASAREFYDEVGESIYKRYDHSSAIRLARAAARRVATAWKPEGIYLLDTMALLQNAPSEMQRRIMASPEIRQLYHQNRVDGYSDTYTDLDPGKVGVDHYDYRRVTDGVMMEQLDGTFCAINYFEELRDKGDELDTIEQIDIMATWEQAMARINAKKEDPTSRWNSAL